MAAAVAGSALLAAGESNGPAPDQGGPGADAPDLLPRLLKRLQDDRDGMRHWSYVESIVLEKRATDGEVRSRTNEVYEVFFQDGRAMKRPLSVDLEQDSQGFNVVRREEARFIPAGTKDVPPARPDKESAFDVERLVRCYQFEPQGDESLGDRAAVRVGFKPVAGCLDDGSRAGRLLQNLTGLLWVDARDSDILRIKGSLEAPVSFGFGLLGRVEHLDLEVQRESLAAGLYAMTHVEYRARGTSFIFHRFDVRSVRERSAFTRTDDHAASPTPDPPRAKGAAEPDRPGGPTPSPR